MARSKILTGARALVEVNGKVIGMFANCSWSMRQDKVPAYILGRFNPAEIVPTSQEPVQLSLTGFRVIGKGPYQVGFKSNGQAFVTRLSQLLQEDDCIIKVYDRQPASETAAPTKDNKVAIFTAEGCRVTGWSSGVAARGVSDIRIDVIGLRGFDESGEDAEVASAPEIDSEI